MEVAAGMAEEAAVEMVAVVVEAEEETAVVEGCVMVFGDGAEGYLCIGSINSLSFFFRAYGDKRMPTIS